MTTTEGPLPTVSPSVPGQRSALALTALLGTGGAAIAALTGHGRPQVLGALAGAVLVGVFFLFGALTTGFVAAHAPQISLVVALMTYTLQVLLLAVVLVGVSRSERLGEALDERWLGGSVLVGALAWTGALVAGAMRGDAR
jgi:ATP synthase protein I